MFSSSYTMIFEAQKLQLNPFQILKKRIVPVYLCPLEVASRKEHSLLQYFFRAGFSQLCVSLHFLHDFFIY